MSLVNQMLRDLEARMPPQDGGLPGGVNAVPRRRSPRVTLPAAAGGALLLAAGASWWWTGRPAPTLAVLSAPPASIAVAEPQPRPPQPPPAAPEPQFRQIVTHPPPPVADSAQQPSLPESTGWIGQLTAAQLPPLPVLPPRPPLLTVPSPRGPIRLSLDFQPLTGTLAPAAAGLAAGASLETAPPLHTPPPPPRVVDKQPRPPDPSQRAAEAYRQALELAAADRRDAARQLLAGALELDPDHHPAREALAALWVEADRPQQARQLLARGLERAPDHAPFARLQGRLLVDTGQLDQAVVLLEQTLAGADDDHLALLAALYQRQGRHQQAARLYLTALSRQPHRGPWWAGLGIALEAAGDQGGARDAYRRARSLDLAGHLKVYVAQRLAALDP